MSRFSLRLRTVVALGIVSAFLIGAQIVVAAPPTKIGTSYWRAGASSVNNGNYTTVVSMSVPAGKYHVSGRITENNQTAETIEQVACNAYGNTSAGGDVAIDTGDGSNILIGLATSFPVDGVLSLPAAGTIRIECISSETTSHNVGAQLVADTVADIINS